MRLEKKKQGAETYDEKVHQSTSTSTCTNHVLWIIPSIFAFGFCLAFTIACLKLRKLSNFKGKEKNDKDYSYFRGPTKEGIYIRERNRQFLFQKGNEDESTSTLNTIGQRQSGSIGGIEGDTSELEDSSRSKSPLQSKAKANRRKFRKHQELQRRYRGNFPLSTWSQNIYGSTTEGKTKDGYHSMILDFKEQLSTVSTETDYNTAAEGDTLELSEEKSIQFKMNSRKTVPFCEENNLDQGTNRRKSI